MSNVFPAVPAIASPPNTTTIPGEQTAPNSVPAGAEGPRFRDFGRALGYNFSRGLLSRKNLKPLLIGSAATVLFLPFDRKISDAVRGDFREFGDSGNVVGGPAGVVTTTGGLLLVTQFTKSGRFHSYVFSETQGLALANAQVFALKYIVRRTRPDGSNQHSFPSAHAANIFVLAAVTSHYYGKKVGIPLYVVACLVAASRVESGSHFPSDAIFGATLGYISAGTAIRGTQHFISALRKTP